MKLVSLRSAAFLTACLISSSVAANEIEKSVSQSDDFKKHRTAFVTAATRLIERGTCTVADFEEVGGFLKSMNHKNKPVYFTYCGGMTIANRLYLNVSTGLVGVDP
ncbi:hypothetical protein [Agrobacterium vaccinii]|uniref:hypothetical protein n=1 Tax=Agrobacterium vaccinii TaxID=2735528 RepID=UPI001E3502E8|nr:hypothetical protein [Agrobacterium vaccinii]UHS56019.1 hypothetical protein HRS00_03925 [Agrobacterium vaccinii]